MAARGVVRIGVSGWRYPPWRGVFYPRGLPQRRELRFIGETFRAVEINGTFYGLQTPGFFESSAAEVPDDFVFAVKGSRFITHNKKLNDVKEPLANFFAQGLLRLGVKLGPVLWQLPPAFRFDAERVESFLAMLPRDSDAMARLARRHDERVRGRAALTPRAEIAVRHAMEIRHESFADPQFIALLRKHDVALVCADSVEWPRLADVTSDFVYCRLHGSEELYASGYDDAALDRWADRVVDWAAGGEPKDAERVVERAARKRTRRDVFVFFDNDAKVRAPYDALGLMARVEKRMGNAGAQ